MGILTKAEILAASDLVTQTVDVPEWGGSVVIRAMSGAQRDAYELSLTKPGADGKFVIDPENMRAKLLLYTLVDEQGNPLFTVDDLAALSAKSAAALARVFVAAQTLNGLDRGAVDEAVKNSDGGPADSSHSGSPLPSA